MMEVHLIVWKHTINPCKISCMVSALFAVELSVGPFMHLGMKDFFRQKCSSLVLQVLSKMTNEATAGRKRSSLFFSFTLSSSHLNLPARFWSLAPPFLCVFLKECDACVPFSPSAYSVDWDPVEKVSVVHASRCTQGPHLVTPRKQQEKKKRSSR